MRRRGFGILLAICLVTGQVSPAWPIWKEGHALVQDCLSDNPGDQIDCLNYVAGVADMVDVMPETAGLAPVCIPPEGVTVGQMGRVVVKYLKNHPEEEHDAAVVLVVVALREAFPCE